MKKLMITACAVAFAAGVQAAVVSWYNNDYTTYVGGQDPAAGATMYLIQDSAHNQDAFISMVIAAGDNFASVQSTVSSWQADYLTAGSWGNFEQPPKSTTAFSAGTAEKAYVVLFDAANKNVFMSDYGILTYNGLADEGRGGYTFNFTAMAADSEAQTDPFKGYTASQGAGWYAVQSVPEPTSGLLLLLGVAGLALRRRRA